MERLTDKLKWYIDAYQNPPFGREVEGTVELLQEALNKLLEYDGLKERGLRLKLPCKLGDTLYFPYIDSETREKVISKEKVTEIVLCYGIGDGELNNCDEIGKIIFLTQAEAEEALKGMEDSK